MRLRLLHFVHFVIAASILGWAHTASAQPTAIYFSDNMEGDVSGWIAGYGAHSSASVGASTDMPIGKRPE